METNRPVLPTILFLTGCMLAGLPSQASAQTNTESTENSASQPVAVLSGFDIEAYGGGFTARGLLDQRVQGIDGQPIGEVLNVVIGKDHSITRLIVNSDGFLGIDETVISIPFDKIDLTPGQSGIEAKIKEDDTDGYSIFSEGEKTSRSAENYRVSALLGDDVQLKDGTRYGYLSDLAFNENGKLEAVIVQPDVSFKKGGYYGYPFNGFGVEGYKFDPYATTYTLPYSKKAIEGTQSFDYDSFKASSMLSAVDD